MRDGDFECRVCHQKLNETDKNCWKCGSTKLLDMRTPARRIKVEAIIAGADKAFKAFLGGRPSKGLGTPTYPRPPAGTIKVLTLPLGCTGAQVGCYQCGVKFAGTADRCELWAENHTNGSNGSCTPQGLAVDYVLHS